LWDVVTLNDTATLGNNSRLVEVDGVDQPQPLKDYSVQIWERIDFGQLPIIGSFAKYGSYLGT
jgi:hypothetical protein